MQPYLALEMLLLNYFDADDCVVVVIALVLYIRLLPGLIVYRVCFEVSIPVACGLT